MRHDGAEDGEQAIERKRRRREQVARDLAVRAAAAGYGGGGRGAFAALLVAGFHEVEGVGAGGVVRGEVGGAEEVFGVVGEVVRDWCC